MLCPAGRRTPSRRSRRTGQYQTGTGTAKRRLTSCASTCSACNNTSSCPIPAGLVDRSKDGPRKKARTDATDSDQAGTTMESFYPETTDHDRHTTFNHNFPALLPPSSAAPCASFDDIFCCDLPCPETSPCEPCWDPHLFPQEFHPQPEPCCGGEIARSLYAECDLEHDLCGFPAQAHSPCQDLGCVELAEPECCEDPQCEDADACCSMPCGDPVPNGCTTCCMSDVCPHPSHDHHHNHLLNGYVPWQRHEHHIHPHHHTTCSSERSSVEPRLSAALQAHLPHHNHSPSTSSICRSTPVSRGSSAPETIRGGHRRLQGASAQDPSGEYTCHWLSSPTSSPCHLAFPTPKDLHTHIQTHHFHSTGPSHPCLWHGCDSTPFTTKPKLSRHLHSHTSYKPHACTHPGCSLSFVTQQQRDVHSKKHTGEKPFSCPTCGKSFAYRDLLKSHLRSGVHGSPVKKFLCAICGEGFSDSSNRTKHTKSVHDLFAGVPCPEPGCEYVDTRREKLRSHCESVGHGKGVAGDARSWEEYFNSQQVARKGGRMGKRKLERESVSVA